MGTYTGIRFKGLVKPEFKDNFEAIALHGEWENHTDPIIKKFGENERANYIPTGGLMSMPDE